MGDGRIHYARNGSSRLAYRVFGYGDVDVVWAQGWATDVNWYDEPGNLYATATQTFSPEARVVVFEGRGTGPSDPVSRVLTPEERAGDLLAVLDAAGSEFPALVTTADAGPASVQFAVTNPARVKSLVFYGSAARFSQKLPDFPWGYTPEKIAQINDCIETGWGQGLASDRIFGSAGYPGAREMFGWMQRVAGATAVRLQWQEAIEVDVRDLLEAVRIPTLVMARWRDRIVPVQASLALATGIPGAKFTPFPRGDRASSTWTYCSRRQSHSTTVRDLSQRRQRRNCRRNRSAVSRTMPSCLAT
jgi:pimeloyl-ACP methyl ester carboxylesterase